MKLYEKTISELVHVKLEGKINQQYTSVETLTQWAISRINHCKGMKVDSILKDGKREKCVTSVFFACFKDNRCPFCQVRMKEFELTEKDLLRNL